MKMILSTEQKTANKLARKEVKELTKKLAIIAMEKNQKPVSTIEIDIICKKSSIWGLNPHCTAHVTYKDGSYENIGTFKCSGSGYDKTSTVIADVFNTVLLYKLHNTNLLQIDEKQKPYGITLREDYKHYSGGIGLNCYYGISKFIGGEFTQTYHGKTEDSFVYTDKE